MGRRLTVLAGAGELVPHVVGAALRAGDDVQVVALTARPEITGATHRAGDLGDPAALIRAVREFGSTHVVMAGAVTLSDRARENLGRFGGGSGASRGDAALSDIGAAIHAMSGAELIAVQTVAADLLAEAGRIAGPAPSAAALAAARHAIKAAQAIGRLDLGQAVVVAGERLVAAEDVGGTDELLDRVARHRAEGRIGDGSTALVLGKAAKPQQTLAIDLPAIGPATIVNAAAAGIALVAVEAWRVLVIDRQDVIAQAEAHGVTVYGMTADD